MKTILISAIGGDIAQCIAQVIRQTYPDWKMIGIDIHERHGGALYVDQYISGLPASDPGYIDWLGSLIKEQGVDICLPTSEAELLRFAQIGIDAIAGATLLTPSFSAIRVGVDKLMTAEFIASIGVPGPWSMAAENADADVSLPCIIKPRRGAGSKSVFICESWTDVAFFRARFPNSILQELLLPADAEVTCAVYRTRAGDTYVLQLLRQLVGGFSGWVEVIENAEIKAQCEKVAQGLDLQGSINIQLRLTAAGPRIFEINPRFSSTSLLRHHMGFSDVVWAVEECLGKPVSPFQPESGRRAVRTQGAAILK